MQCIVCIRITSDKAVLNALPGLEGLKSVYAKIKLINRAGSVILEIGDVGNFWAPQV